MEECCEVGQASSKYLEYGPNNYHPEDINRITNKTILSRELGDILAVLDHLTENDVIDQFEMQTQREKKYWILHKKWEINE